MTAVGTIVNTVFSFNAILVAEWAIGATFPMTGILHTFKCTAKNTTGFFFAFRRQQHGTFFTHFIIFCF